MTKEQELQFLKNSFILPDVFFNEKEFEEYKQTFKKYLDFIDEKLTIEPKPNNDFVYELTYETYISWVKEFYLKINKNYFELVNSINKTILKYFNNKDKTYTAMEVQKILSDNNIFTLFKGFGGVEND